MTPVRVQYLPPARRISFQENSVWLTPAVRKNNQGEYEIDRALLNQRIRRIFILVLIGFLVTYKSLSYLFDSRTSVIIAAICSSYTLVFYGYIEKTRAENTVGHKNKIRQKILAANETIKTLPSDDDLLIKALQHFS